MNVFLGARHVHVHGHVYMVVFLGQGHSRLNLGYLGSFCSLGLGGTGWVCTGVLVSGARDVSGSRLYGGAAGLRSLLAAFFAARMPSASCPSPARAIAAASVAARAGRCVWKPSPIGGAGDREVYSAVFSRVLEAVIDHSTER